MGRTLLPYDELDGSQQEGPNLLQISSNMQNKVNFNHLNWDATFTAKFVTDTSVSVPI